MLRAARRFADGNAPALLLVALFVASRFCFYAAGVQFDLRPLQTSWQILDPVLLRHALWTSVFYMPGQPPLYNVLLGVVVQFFQSDAAIRVALRVLYAAMSLGVVLLLYGVLRRLGPNRWTAFAVAALFLLTPALVLYENIPYYTLPVLLLLGISARLFLACMHRLTTSRALALFLAMTALIYTRSFFQWEWFVVLVAFCALVLPGYRRQVLIAALLPALLIGALYGKNAAITGHFATSDWLGMSLAKLTTLELDHGIREQMVAAGTLSPMALDDRSFEPPEKYPRFFAATRPTGHPVLDVRIKSTDHINFNNLAYAAVSQQALDDALTVIRTRPEVYLRSLRTAWLMSWRPASDYPFLAENRAAIEPYSRVFSKVLAAQPTYPEKPGFLLKPGSVGIFLVIGNVLAMAFGLGVLVRCAWQQRVSAIDASLIFLWLNVMYVAVVGNALEMDENQRFRFAVNPFIAILLAVGAQRTIDYWHNRGRKQKTRQSTNECE